MSGGASRQGPAALAQRDAAELRCARGSLSAATARTAVKALTARSSAQTGPGTASRKPACTGTASSGRCLRHALASEQCAAQDGLGRGYQSPPAQDLVAWILSRSTTKDSRCVMSPARRKMFMLQGCRRPLCPGRRRCYCSSGITARPLGPSLWAWQPGPCRPAQSIYQPRVAAAAGWSLADNCCAVPCTLCRSSAAPQPGSSSSSQHMEQAQRARSTGQERGALCAGLAGSQPVRPSAESPSKAARSFRSRTRRARPSTPPAAARPLALLRSSCPMPRAPVLAGLAALWLACAAGQQLYACLDKLDAEVVTARRAARQDGPQRPCTLQPGSARPCAAATWTTTRPQRRSPTRPSAAPPRPSSTRAPWRPCRGPSPARASPACLP